MSTEIELFSYQDREVRTVLIDGDPWFIAGDVCAVLGYTRGRDAMRMLRDREKGAHSVRTPGGVQEVTIISEQGLYRLVMRSERGEAESFQDWVTGEVLPAIRRTGSYTVPVQRAELSNRDLALMVIAEADRADAAEKERDALAPAAASWETLASGTGDYAVADAAKILSRDPAIRLGRDRLFTLLRELKWLYRQPIDQRHRCYQTVIESGRLSEIPMSHYHPRTAELITDPPQIRVTVKGLAWLHQHLAGTSRGEIEQ